jgi:hypothetical protein
VPLTAFATKRGLWLVKLVCLINAVSTCHPTLHLDEGRILIQRQGLGVAGGRQAAIVDLGPSEYLDTFFPTCKGDHSTLKLSALDQHRSQTAACKAKDNRRLRGDEGNKSQQLLVKTAVQH